MQSHPGVVQIRWRSPGRVARVRTGIGSLTFDTCGILLGDRLGEVRIPRNSAAGRREFDRMSWDRPEKYKQLCRDDLGDRDGKELPGRWPIVSKRANFGRNGRRADGWKRSNADDGRRPHWPCDAKAILEVEDGSTPAAGDDHRLQVSKVDPEVDLKL
jgi:hypothetical protein